MTSDRNIMADVNRIFTCLERSAPSLPLLRSCRTLLVSPVFMRRKIMSLINREIRHARKKKPASILLKLNSLSDEELINRLYEAAKAGVEIRMVIRGIMCMLTEQKKFKKPVQAVSIVDEYLEHARVMIFHNMGKEDVYISSADWMVRNLDHRIEAACPIFEEDIKSELKDILLIQLKDNVKARILDNELANHYADPGGKVRIRSQVATYGYLKRKGK
jgi:polyphosphate kinase